MLQFKVLITDEDKKLKFVAIELKRTQKTLCLLNNETNSLEHLVTSGKLFGDHSGVGFKGKSSGTKTMFIKSDYLLNLLMSQIISLLSNLPQQKVSLLNNSLLQQVNQ